MSDLLVRPMQTDDLPVVGDLAAALVEQHHSFDQRRFFLVPDVAVGYRRYFAGELGKDRVVLLSATLDGAVVGYLYGSVEGRDWARLLDKHGAIHDIFVADTARRRGVARLLMTTAIGTFEQLGVPQVVLSSATPNVDAQALFRALGFRATMVEMTR